MMSASLLQAQEKKGRGPGGGRGGLTIEAVETAVGTLTADQKTKITAIIEKANKARQELMGAGDPQQNVGKMQEINTTMRSEIRALLTAEQQAKFDEMPQGRGQGRGQGKKKGQ